MLLRRTRLTGLLCLSLLVLISCAGTPQVLAPEPKNIALIKEDIVSEPALNISILTFNDKSRQNVNANKKVFPQVRAAEGEYLPFVLREALVESGHWGAVRVVPDLDPTAEILISAEILVSNAIELKLDVRAWDSTGQIWIDRTYEDWAIDHSYRYDMKNLVEPFQDLFNKIANDLYMVRRVKTEKSLSNMLDTSMLRYAMALSPKAFSEYLEIGDDGLIILAGLPARDDVMYERASKIREAEYEFIDIVDEQYENFYKKMQLTYAYWRQYSYELIEYNKRIEQSGSTGRKKRQGSWEELDDIYKAYQESKMNEDELRELAASFDAEITPTVTELEGTVIKLTGSLKSQYEEWRALLQKIYAQERGS